MTIEYKDSKRIVALSTDTVETLIRSVIYDNEDQYNYVIDAGTGVETSVNDAATFLQSGSTSGTANILKGVDVAAS